MNPVYQAIATRYLGATNYRGSRIKATASAGSVTVGYDHALNLSENHLAAAVALANKFDWLSGDRPGKLITGGLANGDFVHVLTFPHMDQD